MKNQLKKLISLALCIAVCLSMIIVPASAAEITDSGKCGNDATWTLDRDGLLTISGRGKMTWPLIDDDVNDYRAVPWYSIRSKIKSVNIEEGVTSIFHYAFYDCYNLISVNIPSTVYAIGYGAFKGSTSISYVNIADIKAWAETEFYDDSSSPTSISKDIYLNGELITDLVIPSGTKYIGFMAFYGCKSINKISIPDSVTTIEYGAFLETGYAKNPSNFYEGVLYIGNCCITADPISYTGGNIKSGTRLIANCAFMECGILSAITIPSSVKHIGYAAFCECVSLKKITIPSGVTKIEPRTFWYCESLTSVSLPSGLTEIGDEAFLGCFALNSLTIPKSVMKVGASIAAGTGFYLDESNWKNDVLYYGNILLESYYNEPSYEIKSGTRVIADYAFQGCFGIENVKIPSSVKAIGDYAFYGCSGLKTLTGISSVPTIGNAAFYGCTSLADRKGFTIVNDILFYYSSTYECPVIPSNVKRIDEAAFWDYNITNLTIPVSVTKINDYALENNWLKRIDYEGSRAQWNKIDMNPNKALNDSDVYFHETVEVTLADFPIKLGEQVMDSKNEEYPFIIYNNITYLPLTYYGCRALGLTSQWLQYSGLFIERTGEVLTYVPTPATSSNTGTLTAEFALDRIILAGTEINNSKEEYPFLIFRDVTYLPMTWKNMNDILGCSYAYDAETGLTVGTAKNPNFFEVQMATFPVKLGDQTIDCADDQYPFIIYNGITYLPLTYYGCGSLGLTSNWAPTSGLVIATGGDVTQYQKTPNTESNDGTMIATRASGSITLNGNWIDNRFGDYPFLVFREITYMPMTWHYMFDILGCEYSFDSASGLSIGLSQY